MTTFKTLMTGAAAIALAAATPALAQTSTEAETDMEAQVEMGDEGVNAEAGSDTMMDLDNDGETVGEEIADTAEETGDYISETADDVAENVDETMDDAMDSATPETLTASTLVGFDVTAGDGEVIGEVDDVVLIDGKEMAVVGIGGFLGLGEHDVALPLSDLQTVSGDEQMLETEGYTRAELESMAEYDPEAAQEMGDDEPVMLGAS